MRGHPGRPPGRHKPAEFPPLASMRAPELKFGDFCSETEGEKYPRYFNIIASQQTQQYRNMTKGLKLSFVYKFLKENKIQKNIIHQTRFNGDIYLVALDKATSERLSTLKDGEISIVENSYDNKSEGFLFNHFWTEEDPEWVKGEILEDHKEISSEDIYVFTNPNGKATGRVKICFQDHTRPHRIRIGLQTIRVDQPKAIVNVCKKCFRIGHKEAKCRDTRNPNQMCMKCRDAHNPEIECNYISCANCKGDHATNSSECQAVEREKELRQRAIDQNISFTHAKILEEQNIIYRQSDYANIGNKQD